MTFTKVDEQTGISHSFPNQLIIFSDEAATRDKTLAYNADVKIGHTLEILAIRVELTNSAIAGTRRINVLLEDSGADVVRQLEFAVTNAVVSTTQIWECGLGVVERFGSDVAIEVLPQAFFLLPGQSMKVNTVGGDAGDTAVVHIWGRLST